MGELFNVILYQPLVNLLVGLYDLFPWGGLGLAIILLTVLVKTLVLPLTYKTLKAQKELQEIQPKINEIKEKYKNDKETQAKELMNVYKHHNVNPFASCLPTIIQLFVFIALSQVLYTGVKTIDPAMLYPFIHNPGVMNHSFLFMDLGAVSIPLAILCALMQYVQAKQMVQTRPPKIAREGSASLDEDMTASMNKMTVTVLPIMMLFMGIFTLPGGTMLYIFVSTFLTWLMYAFFVKPKPEHPLQEQNDGQPKIVDAGKTL